MLTSVPEIEVVNGVKILRFGPEFQTICEDLILRLGPFLLRVGEEPPFVVILDLSHTTFFSSSFIECLFRLWNRVKKNSGRMCLAGLTPNCADIIHVTQLHRIWEIADSVEEAIHKFETIEAD